MRSAYSWQLRGFLSALGLLLLTQVVILGVGINGILGGYTRGQLVRLEQQARHVLLAGETADADAWQYDGPFFVFSADRSLVYSNRGMGKSIAPEEYTPVEYDGAVIGYFFADQVRFLSYDANRVFLVSVGVLVVLSMAVSSAIAAFAASRSARTISHAVQGLQVDLATLRSLEPVATREFAVKELSEMSRRLHEVSVVLAGEDEYKGQWMQDIAHDLRSPLSGLKGQLEAMRDGVLEPTPARFARTLLDITRLEEMVTSISELHSIEVISSISTEVIATESILGELTTGYETQLKESGCTMACTSETPYFRANHALLLRALGNIVSNAIIHAGPDIVITVNIYDDAGETVIRVANNGPSIPEDQLPRVFQRFSRGDFSRSTPGNGLGLNIAMEIAVRHGGSIHAENLAPTGVAFVIRLPIVDGAADSDRTSGETVP